MKPWIVRTDRKGSEGDLTSSRRIRVWLARILLRSAEVLSPEAIDYRPEYGVEAEPALREDVSPFEAGTPPPHWVERVRRGAPELLAPLDEEIARSSVTQDSLDRGFDSGRPQESESRYGSPAPRGGQEPDLRSRIPTVVATQRAHVSSGRPFLFGRRSATTGDSLNATGTKGAKSPKQESDSSDVRDLSTDPTAQVERGFARRSARNVTSDQGADHLIKHSASQSSTVGPTRQTLFEPKPDEPPARRQFTTPGKPGERVHRWSKEGDRDHTYSPMPSRNSSQFPSLPPGNQKKPRQTSARTSPETPTGTPSASVSQVRSNAFQSIAPAPSMPIVRTFPPFASDGAARSPTDAIVVNSPLFAEDFDPWPELPELQSYALDAGSLSTNETERWRGVSKEQWGDR